VSGTGSPLAGKVSFVSKDLVRRSVFFALAVFMLAGPAYRQVLDGDNRVFRNWVMFSAIGVGLVDARFTHLTEDGSEVILNHHELLAGQYRKVRRSNIWLIRNRNGGAVDVARRLCAVLDPITSIRIESRVATRRGWVTDVDGEIVNCGAP